MHLHLETPIFYYKVLKAEVAKRMQIFVFLRFFLQRLMEIYYIIAISTVLKTVPILDFLGLPCKVEYKWFR